MVYFLDLWVEKPQTTQAFGPNGNSSLERGSDLEMLDDMEMHIGDRSTDDQWVHHDHQS